MLELPALVNVWSGALDIGWPSSAALPPVDMRAIRPVPNMNQTNWPRSMADSSTSFPGQDESLGNHRQPDELTVDEELAIFHFKLEMGDNGRI